MTDTEIKNAFKCLRGCTMECIKCPYSSRYSYPLCQRQVAEDTFSLNARQQLEIDKLKVENQSLRTVANSLKTHYAELQKHLKTAKSEAVKEFAERLKDIFEHAYQFEYGYLLSKDVINTKLEKCLKEMVGESNE